MNFRRGVAVTLLLFVLGTGALFARGIPIPGLYGSREKVVKMIDLPDEEIFAVEGAPANQKRVSNRVVIRNKNL